MENSERELETPKISIIATAFRPQNWMDLYSSIGDNDISFEVVFVGPNDPDFELPTNFKFIKSYTKPVQCVEIASRNATADLILQISDDSKFRTTAPLDRLYNTYKSYNNDKLILSCRFMRDEEVWPLKEHRIFPHEDKSSPFMPMCGLMSRRLYRDIGGMDRNFIAVMADLDLDMRILELGGEVKFCDDVRVEEFKSKSFGSTLCNDYWHHDRKLLLKLWSKRRILCPTRRKTRCNRARPVESFSDHRILEESQDPKGRWV
jgi:hypothetical protein